MTEFWCSGPGAVRLTVFGAVVRLGGESGVETPVNEAVTLLIRFRQSGFPDVV